MSTLQRTRGGPVHMRTRVPLMLASPNLETKAPTFEHQMSLEYDYFSLKLDVDGYFM